MYAYQPVPCIFYENVVVSFRNFRISRVMLCFFFLFFFSPFVRSFFLYFFIKYFFGLNFSYTNTYMHEMGMHCMRHEAWVCIFVSLNVFLLIILFIFFLFHWIFVSCKLLLLVVLFFFSFVDCSKCSMHFCWNSWVLVVVRLWLKFLFLFFLFNALWKYFFLLLLLHVPSTSFHESLDDHRRMSDGRSKNAFMYSTSMLHIIRLVSGSVHSPRYSVHCAALIYTGIAFNARNLSMLYTKLRIFTTIGVE